MSNKQKILLVCTDVSELAGVVGIFGCIGTGTISHAKNGALAVEIYESDPSYDLIFVSIDMPGMNGITTAKLLRQHQVAKRPYIVGAASIQDYCDKALKSGMDAYLVVPSLSDSRSAFSLHLLKGGRSI